MVGQMTCQICPHRLFDGMNHICTAPGKDEFGVVQIKQGWKPYWCPLLKKPRMKNNAV